MHIQLAKFICAWRLNPSHIDLMLFGRVMIPKSIGYFLLYSEKIMIVQIYCLNDNTQQLNLSSNLSATIQVQHKTGEVWQDF